MPPLPDDEVDAWEADVQRVRRLVELTNENKARMGRLLENLHDNNAALVDLRAAINKR